MTEEILLETEEKMQGGIDSLKKEFASLRAGRANPQMLDKVQIDYYGSMSPINQVANIAVPEARLLTIQPWDKSMLDTIEKAILKSDLGLNPSNDGTIIRIAIPQLTSERRAELVKQIKKMAEETKVRIRNNRRDSNEKFKKLEKDKEITEDESKGGQDDIQKLTDKYIKEVDTIASAKENEIMEV